MVGAALAGAAPASAAPVIFTVDSIGATADPGINQDCDVDATADDDCTLASAIAESNANADRDIIVFNHTDDGTDPDDVVFNTDLGPSYDPAQVSIGPTLPTITDGVAIDAGNCSQFDPFDPTPPPTPCAILLLSSPFLVDAAGDVSLAGLAFGASGVDVVNVDGEDAAVPDFKLTNTWVGIDTLGFIGTEVIGAAVTLRAVDGAVIGGTSEFDRNVFARWRSGPAIEVFGADNTKVRGNTFGLRPDGDFARTGEATLNGDAIDVSGDGKGTPSKLDDDPAAGTQIGVTLDPVSAGTTVCDGGCNQFVGGGAAVALDGRPEVNGIPAASPAGNPTLIRGNVIGVGGALPAQALTGGILVGDADGIVIGGPAANAADRNVVAKSPITSQAGSTNLTVQGNFIGISASGNELAAPPSLPTLSLGGSGVVEDNRLAGRGSGSPPDQGSVIDLSGPAAMLVRGNLFGEFVNGNPTSSGFAAIRIRTSGQNKTIGGASPGDGNVISSSDAGTRGILVEGDVNDVLGNTIGISSAGAARPMLVGVSMTDVSTPASGDADGNQVGGDTPASENLISNLTGDAIRITGPGSDGNLIGRNRGAANGDLFIDLLDDGAGNPLDPLGSNSGAQAPAITAVLPGSASGSAAPNAAIRLFTKANATPGELAGFLAETTADGAGNWTATFADRPQGELVAATATVVTDTSELSAPAAVPASPTDPVPPPDSAPPTDPPPDNGGAAIDIDRPETILTTVPKNRISTRSATYKFRSDEAGATFRCKIDRKPFKPCASPLRIKRLKNGKHSFQVIATDGAGNADPTAAKDSFKKT